MDGRLFWISWQKIASASLFAKNGQTDPSPTEKSNLNLEAPKCRFCVVNNFKFQPHGRNLNWTEEIWFGFWDDDDAWSKNTLPFIDLSHQLSCQLTEYLHTTKKEINHLSNQKNIPSWEQSPQKNQLLTREPQSNSRVLALSENYWVKKRIPRYLHIESQAQGFARKTEEKLGGGRKSQFHTSPELNFDLPWEKKTKYPLGKFVQRNAEKSCQNFQMFSYIHPISSSREIVSHCIDFLSGQ